MSDPTRPPGETDAVGSPAERELRPGVWAAVRGGFLGVLTPGAFVLAVVLAISGQWRNLAVDANRTLTAVFAFLLTAAIVGVPAGFVGRAVALRVRRSRHADWSDDRTAYLGGYVAGTLASPLLCCPFFGVQ